MTFCWKPSPPNPPKSRSGPTIHRCSQDLNISVLALSSALPGVMSPQMHQCLSTEIDGIASKKKTTTSSIKPDDAQKSQRTSSAVSLAVAGMLSSEPTAWVTAICAVRESWKHEACGCMQVPPPLPLCQWLPQPCFSGFLKGNSIYWLEFLSHLRQKAWK